MSTRRVTPAAVVMSPTAAITSKLNAGAARTWNAGRRLAKAARGAKAEAEDLDFNALSASLQAILAHARRRQVPDTAIILAIGASIGPIASTVPEIERASWVERLSSVIHASARITELGVEDAR